MCSVGHPFEGSNDVQENYPGSKTHHRRHLAGAAARHQAARADQGEHDPEHGVPARIREPQARLSLAVRPAMCQLGISRGRAIIDCG